MRKRHHDTLIAIYEGRPVKWPRLTAMLEAIGAKLKERKGSRVAVILGNEVMVLHKPHRSQDVGRATVKDIGRILKRHGIEP